MGACNIFGTLNCKEEDGTICAKCKTGYMGNKCQFCESEDLIISGSNGFVNDNGQGVKCSKSLFQLQIIDETKLGWHSNIFYIQVLIQ